MEENERIRSRIREILQEQIETGQGYTGQEDMYEEYDGGDRKSALKGWRTRRKNLRELIKRCKKELKTEAKPKRKVKPKRKMKAKRKAKPKAKKIKGALTALERDIRKEEDPKERKKIMDEFYKLLKKAGPERLIGTGELYGDIDYEGDGYDEMSEEEEYEDMYGEGTRIGAYKGVITRLKNAMKGTRGKEREYYKERIAENEKKLRKAMREEKKPKRKAKRKAKGKRGITPAMKKWINFVKKVQKEYDLSYKEALQKASKLRK